MRRTTLGMLLAMAGAAVGTGCATSSGEAITVSDPWFRATAPFANTAAFYATIENQRETRDALVSVSSDRCQEMELHLTVVEDGIASMRALDAEGLAIDAGEELRLQPGGAHAMCLGMDGGLEDGADVAVTLSFEIAADIELRVPVRR